MIYFIGVGGIGVSALARWFLAQNWAVLGSDAVQSGLTRELEKEGVEVKIGQKKGNLEAKGGKIDLVVASQAVKGNHPEVLAALKLGVPILTYPQAVGLLTGTYKTLAVAGAHGKSTTTSLLGLILKKAGLDPTVIVGTKLKEFGGRNFRCGKSGYLVLEADEYGRAFLNYSPTLSIVTNVDKEHLDTYRNFAEIKKTFLKFLSQTENGGVLILNRDDKPLRSLKNQIKIISAPKNLRVIWYSSQSRAADQIKKIIKIPGRHNVSNALAALATAKVIGVNSRIALRAIGEYRGSWRRMEYRGKCQIAKGKWHDDKANKNYLPLAIRSLPVYDDYAHHPTEIKAALQAFREKFPESKIICVFQPHQAKRLKLLFKDFIGALGEADALILLPIYKVAGRDRTDRKYAAQKLAAAIAQKYPAKPVFYLNNPKKIKQETNKILYSKSYILNPAVIVMMGAGDIVNYTDSLIK